MNLDDISTQLLFITVPIISVKHNGVAESGTGFLVMHENLNEGSTIPILVTNYHVIGNSQKNILLMTSADENGKPQFTSPIDIELDEKANEIYFDEKLDLAIIFMAPIFNRLLKSGQSTFYRTIPLTLIPEEKVIIELSALEEIIFIGYPAGIRDSSTRGPIIRRGITATPVWRNFNGQPRFLIDAGVFPGSSGSPVFILNRGSYTTPNGISIGNRLYFLGIIVTSAFTQADPEKEKTYLGLGEVIKSSMIKEFIQKILSNIPRV